MYITNKVSWYSPVMFFNQSHKIYTFVATYIATTFVRNYSLIFFTWVMFTVCSDNLNNY